MEDDSPRSINYDNPNPALNIEGYNDEGSFDAEALYEVKPLEHKLQLHKYIGALLASNKTLPKQVIKGSGVLISPDLVLTVAHNVWLRQGNQENYNIKFYPGLCGPLSANPCYDCTVVYYPEDHKVSEKPIHDYALLQLSQPILDKEDDFLPLSPSINGDLGAANGIMLAIYGYPAVKYVQLDSRAKETKACQWGLVKSDLIVEIKEKSAELLHKISTLKGQSGCPIVDIDEDSPSIVGIHKGSAIVTINSQKVTINVGRIITTDLIETLEREAKKKGACMFRVK